MSARKFVAPDSVVETYSKSSSYAEANEYGNGKVIAGLTGKGEVLTFVVGNEGERYGGDISRVRDHLNSGVRQIYSSGRGFAAVKNDETIVHWGFYGSGVREYGDERSVKKIVSSGRAFVAILDDGSLDAWGDSGAGGELPEELVDVKGIQKVVSIGWGFAALLADGEVVSWGNSHYASDPETNPEFTPGETKVIDLVSSRGSFAALRDDGTVAHWGGSVFNTATKDRAHHLANSFDWNGADDNLKAEKIYTSNYGIAVVRSDSSIASFARGTGNGIVNIDNSGLKIEKIVGGEKSFAALRSDGSVIAWGNYMPGGVVNLNVGSPPIRKPVDLVYSGSQYLDAYGVLFDDGTVQTWGHYKAGGGSLDNYHLNGINGDLEIITLKGGGDQFSVLRSDGSVVSWGSRAPSETPEILSSGVAKLYSASLALLQDGTFVQFYKSGDEDVVNHFQPESPIVALVDPLTEERLNIAGGIENSGLISVLKDKEGYLWAQDHANDYVDIKFRNKPITETIRGWKVVAAEKIQDMPKLILKNVNGTIVKLDLDKNWNGTRWGKRHRPGTRGFEKIEEEFQIDLDDDGAFGKLYRTVESNGNIELQVDSYGFSRIRLANGETKELTIRGKHARIAKNLWSLKAAESINGNNILVLSHSNGRFAEWSFDNEWNLSAKKSYRSGSSQLRSLEQNFSSDLDGDGLIGEPPAIDNNADGLSDGPQSYKLIQDGQSVTLTNRRGRTFSDRSSRFWDAVKAVQTESGFQVLLEGVERRAGRFLVWSTNAAGVITRNSGWKTNNQMANLGYEDIFMRDFNQDGITGSPPARDDNGDGLSDDSSIYKLFQDGQAFTLTNRRGRTFSDQSSRYWDAVKAVRTESGFQVLLGGQGRRLGRYLVWSTDAAGVIIDSSGWKNGNQMSELGFEEVFIRDFNGDNKIANKIIGSENSDLIEGNVLSNEIHGLAGEDTIYGLEGNDTIFGGLGNDTIDGGAGADILIGGSGMDLFLQNDGDSLGYTAQTAFSENALVAGGTITFANSVDRITDFTGGAGGDLIDVETAGQITTLNPGDMVNSLDVGLNYLVRGNFNTGTSTFTQNNAGDDALILVNAQSSILEEPNKNNFVVTFGTGASLVASNFI